MTPKHNTSKAHLARTLRSALLLGAGTFSMFFSAPTTKAADLPLVIAKQGWMYVGGQVATYGD